ncbi:MAG: prepilin-type N-terminal cleavage/methylation domain-containing protein [Magnetococcales bacterium]|nr:prepilin-type N-terminal cleavage/methylation domain-containing protein [Magnetococcales bacterium]MBF0157822.1 prepilin-type N-terminal cleavage/methylation domain-containing protein [Magnetococcales bacterium]
MSHRGRQGGFTLVELLVSLAIVALLTSFAVPAYLDHVRRAGRSAAEQLIVEAATRQEQYMLDSRSYTTSFTSLGFSSQDWVCTSSECTNDRYRVTMATSASATPPTFTITATAQGSQLADGDLVYDSTGTKTRLVNGTDEGW